MNEFTLKVVLEDTKFCLGCPSCIVRFSSDYCPQLQKELKRNRTTMKPIRDEKCPLIKKEEIS